MTNLSKLSVSSYHFCTVNSHEIQTDSEGLPHFLSTFSVRRGCFSLLVQFPAFQSPCSVISSTFSFQNLLKLLLLFAAPMSDQILITFFSVGCSVASFPSSFHIFGCDPAGPSDSLLLNAAAHQSTPTPPLPQQFYSSSLLPEMSNSRRGAFQTFPAL